MTGRALIITGALAALVIEGLWGLGVFAVVFTVTLALIAAVTR